ncbi:MAG: hypothetical protein LBJ13_03775 [Puniceicoccales bacterium]|jgi:hypothetical protein|nr:hypothetical protein [Puniceicoccales bacterium]
MSSDLLDWIQYNHPNIYSRDRYGYTAEDYATKAKAKGNATWYWYLKEIQLDLDSKLDFPAKNEELWKVKNLLAEGARYH